MNELQQNETVQMDVNVMADGGLMTMLMHCLHTISLMHGNALKSHFDGVCAGRSLLWGFGS
eukprot:scaffold507231_cov17-Prasinocladus_malaysianus.AAC.1